jgi:hypothetical protein
VTTTNDPTTALVERLEAAGFGPRPSGPDSWESRCPAHDGSRRNLTVTRAEDGKVLLHCQAHGCQPAEIVAALGLELSALFPEDGTPPKPSANGKAKTKTTRRKARPHPTPEDAIARTVVELGKPTSHWIYHRADGTEAARVYRFDPPGGRKEFRPVHSTPEGWVMGDPPGLWPPYRLPELDGALRVYVTEGEKAADLVRGLGLTATTSAHGAKAAHKSDWSPLAGRDVVILPDADPEGEDYLRDVLAALARLSPRPTARILRLADLWRTEAEVIRGGDAEEWLSDGVPQAWEPEQCREELERSADRVEPEGLDAPLSAVPEEEDDEDPVEDDWPDPPGGDAFHGIAGEFVRLVEEHTEADRAALLFSFLVAAGNMLGRGPRQLVAATRHHLNLNACLVGPSGRGRKGTSLDITLEALGQVDEVWRRGRISGGLSSGEGLIYHVRDERRGQEPVKQGGRVVDYQEVVVDPGVEDKRLLAIESEFASVLRRMARDGNTLSAVIRQAFDSGQLATLTKGYPQRATGAHISIVGHITKADLNYLAASDASNGFANRFLWIASRRSKLLPEGGDLDLNDLVDIVDPLVAARDFARKADAGSEPDILLVRDRDARDLWADAYPRLTRPRPGLFGAVTGRAEVMVLRLSGLYTALDCSRTIRAEHMLAALACWDYAERSAASIFGSALEDPVEEKIVQALRDAGPQGITRTELSTNVFKKHIKADELRSKLTRLLGEGLLRKEVEPTRGRFRERFYSV